MRIQLSKEILMHMNEKIAKARTSLRVEYEEREAGYQYRIAELQAKLRRAEERLQEQELLQASSVLEWFKMAYGRKK